MTLDWLLVVGAVAALAAVTAHVVQRAVEDEVTGVEDPVALMLDAEVAAASVVDEAYEAAVREAAANPSFRPDDPAFVAPFRLRCEELATARRFGEVVLGAALVVSPAAERPFRCELVFLGPSTLIDAAVPAALAEMERISVIIDSLDQDAEQAARVGVEAAFAAWLDEAVQYPIGAPPSAGDSPTAADERDDGVADAPASEDP